jgi:hypothetical protein
MAIIKEDNQGLYAKVGGWVSRPINQTTNFKKGEKIVGHHFRGSSKVGMGKLDGKHNYSEYWKVED